MLLDPITNTKKCSNKLCEETDPKAFGKNKAMADGLSNQCRKCLNSCGRRSKEKYSEKVLIANQLYRESNRAAINEKCKTYRENNREACRQRWQRYKEENREGYLRSHKKSRETEKYKNRFRKWLINNSERSKAIKKKWQDSNPEARVVIAQRRRARKRALPVQWSLEHWELCLAHFCDACAYCGAQGNMHQDHFIPLASPGCPGTVPWNIVPACPSCNLKKGSRIWPTTPAINAWVTAQKEKENYGG